METEELERKKREYVKIVHERLGELSNDPREVIALWQELFTPEAVAVLEKRRRWEAESLERACHRVVM